MSRLAMRSLCSVAAGPAIQAAVTVTDLRVRFGALDVIDGMNLRIAAREFVSLLGPSGCGKSTLLRAIAGLIAPTGGSVTLGAPDMRVGLMFQKPLLLPWRSALDNVLLPVE